MREALIAARKWIADDLAKYFDKDGETIIRVDSFKDFDLTEQIALIDKIDAALRK